MKTECVFSEPVRVSTDELLTELLRRLPEATVAEALAAACRSAQRRTNTKRHSRYKCQLFFRRLTGRLGTVPDNLAQLVGLKPYQLELGFMSHMERTPLNRMTVANLDGPLCVLSDQRLC